MDQNEEKIRSELRLGWFFFTMFGILIVTGIIVKRVLGYPELMMLFHAPAAVFLILAGRKLTVKLNRQYQKDSDTVLEDESN